MNSFIVLYLGEDNRRKKSKKILRREEVNNDYENPKNEEYSIAGYSILRVDNLKFNERVCNEILQSESLKKWIKE